MLSSVPFVYTFTVQYTTGPQKIIGLTLGPIAYSAPRSVKSHAIKLRACI
jgi:hypothetical protein